MTFVTTFIRKVFRSRSKAAKKREEREESNAGSSSQQIAEGVVIPFALEDVTKPFVCDIKKLESLAHVNKGRVRLGTLLESGTFGEVWKGVWSHGETSVAVAVKFFVPKYDTAKQERKILSHLHFNSSSGDGTEDCVVKLIGCGSFAQHEFVVLEFIEGECIDMLCYQNKFAQDLKFTKNVFLNLAVAMQSLHERKVVHRDIKAENVIVSKGSNRVRLIDFGCSLLFQDKPFPAGTSPYVAPEVWKAIRTNTQDKLETEDGLQVDKTDIFSFGILMWTCLAGQLPFANQSLDDIKKKIIAGTIPPIDETWPKDLQCIMQMCMQTNPQDRVDSTQLVHLLKLVEI